MNQRAYFIISSSNCWLGIRLEFAGTVIIGAAALLAVLFKNPANTMFTSMAALAISYSLNTTQSLNWVVRMTTDMETQIVDVEHIEECLGCKKNKNKNHNGIYCKVMNWKTNRSIKFISLIK